MGWSALASLYLGTGELEQALVEAGARVSGLLAGVLRGHLLQAALLALQPLQPALPCRPSVRPMCMRAQWPLPMATGS